MKKINSPTILTVVGSIGVGITAVMAARDTVKAMNKIEDEECRKFTPVGLVPLTKKEKFKIAAPCYIPTLISGVSTILCICGANKMNKDIQQALTGAYVLLDQSYKEYRNAVKEVYTEDGERKVAKELASRGIDSINEDADDLFFDFYSLRFFDSKLSTIREAEEKANEILKSQGSISLRTVYSLIGEDLIDPCGLDDSLGWSVTAGKMYGYDRIEIKVEQAISKEGKEYYIIDFMDAPTEDYWYV